MCPVCLASMGLIVAGAVSTGGLAALAVKVSRKKNDDRLQREKSVKPESAKRSEGCGT
jgi:hypothetical protein